MQPNLVTILSVAIGVVVLVNTALSIYVWRQCGKTPSVSEESKKLQTQIDELKAIVEKNRAKITEVDTNLKSIQQGAGHVTGNDGETSAAGGKSSNFSLGVGETESGGLGGVKTPSKCGASENVRPNQAFRIPASVEDDDTKDGEGE